MYTTEVIQGNEGSGEREQTVAITDNRVELKTHKLFSGYRFSLQRLQYTYSQ